MKIYDYFLRIYKVGHQCRGEVENNVEFNKNETSVIKETFDVAAFDWRVPGR